MEFSPFRIHLEPALTAQMHKLMDRTDQLTSNEAIRSYVRHLSSIAMGGKRIRPYVASLGYRGVSGQSDDAILHALVGIEIFHLFALVHDDIMDKSALRHGVPSAHAYAESVLTERTSSIDHSHTAQGQAILLGDLLLTLAHECFQELEETGAIDPVHIRKARRLFMEMGHEVIIGQMLDLELSGNMNATKEQILEKHRLKTAWYTMVRPLQIGAALAGASNDVLTWCAEFGEPLGIGFQITDDLLDCTTPSETLGKPRLQDVREGQPTLITEHIMAQGSEQDKASLGSFFGKNFGPEDEETLLAFLESSQAITASTQTAAAYFTHAEGKIASCPFTVDATKECEQFVALMKGRTV